jgi:azurin
VRRKFGALALLLLAHVGHANAQGCDVVIEGNDQIQFVQSELRVSSSCSEVTVTLMHIGSLAANIMGHNWVLAATGDYQSDARVIAATSVVGGGEQTSVTFDISGLEAGGDYTYFCSFPGHFVLMNGKFIIE